MINLIPPRIYTSQDFGGFKGESRPSSRATDLHHDSIDFERPAEHPQDRSAPLHLDTPVEGG